MVEKLKSLHEIFFTSNQTRPHCLHVQAGADDGRHGDETRLGEHCDRPTELKRLIKRNRHHLTH